MSPPTWTGGVGFTGGVAGPEGPPVPGYSLWLDAQNPANNSSTWFDQSGNHNDATISSGATLQAGVINGFPGYSCFDAVISTAPYDCPGSTTVFVVAQPATLVSQAVLITAYDSTSTVNSYVLTYGGQDGSAAGYGIYGAGNTWAYGGADRQSGGSANMVVGGRTDSTAPNGGIVQTLTYDGAIAAYAFTSSPGDQTSARVLAGPIGGVTGSSFDGYLGAVLEYPFALSDAQMLETNEWLAARYGFSGSVPWAPTNYGTGNGLDCCYDVGSNTVWFGSNQDGGTITTMDATDGTVLNTATVTGYFEGSGMLTDGTSVWSSAVQTGGGLFAINISTYAITTYPSLTYYPLYFDGTSIWCAGSSSPGIIAVSTSGSPGTFFSLPYNIAAITGDGGTNLVVAGAHFNAGSTDVIYQVDPSDGSILQTWVPNGTAAGVQLDQALGLNAGNVVVGAANSDSYILINLADFTSFSTYFISYTPPPNGGLGGVTSVGTSLNAAGNVVLLTEYGFLVELAFFGLEYAEPIELTSTPILGVSGSDLCVTPLYYWVLGSNNFIQLVGQ